MRAAPISREIFSYSPCNQTLFYIVDDINDADNPTRIDVTITNDTLNDPDHEFVTVRFFSHQRCMMVEADYEAEFPPTDEDIAKLIAKWEGADPSDVIHVI